MSTHVSIPRNEAADRLAIRELVGAYEHCADRRDAKGQMALFTPDTHFAVYMNAEDAKPSHSKLPKVCTTKLSHSRGSLQGDQN